MNDLIRIKDEVRSYAREIEKQITDVHIACFKDSDIPLFLISNAYPGVWMEHIYDSVTYAKLYPEHTELPKNTLRLFMSHQTAEGQLPCYVWNGDKINLPPERLIGYGQIQECVSFGRMCLMTYNQTGDAELLKECYDATVRWVNWLKKHRMTSNRGLIEMFVGYDTGHDNSGRLEGMKYHGNRSAGGNPLNAGTPPEEDDITPILAVDMNCNFYGNLCCLAEMADILGYAKQAKEWRTQAAGVKAKLFEHCFDKDDCFFYDADKNGNHRKYRSSTIFHLFLERVLDVEADAEIIKEIYTRYIGNPNEFKTPYPFPSMSISDPSWRKHTPRNCWGYFTQGNIELRCTLWMDHYGWGGDFDNLCARWVEQWTKYRDTLKVGQELDPVTGEPSNCSPWYSTGMLTYLYGAKRLGLID